MTGQPAARAGSVEQWARTKPDAEAAIEGDARLNWSDLDDKANRLAASLTRLGLQPGSMVAVRTQIRLEWLVINAALAKLDCMLLGVNWRLTPPEMGYVLENSQARALICDDADPSALLAEARRCGLGILVSIDASAAEFADFADFAKLLADPAPALFSRLDTPLVIYTSGTTGRPRGVLLGRRASDPPPDKAMLEYAASISAAVPKSENDTILVAMPLSHGSAPAQIRRCIQAGGRIVLMRRFSPEAALALTQEHRISAWVMVPTMLNRMAALPEEIVSRYDMCSLTSIQVGAAPVYAGIKAWAVKHFGQDVLHESYGSTETGMVSHLSPEMYRQKPRSCGKPYANVKVSIRDADGKELSAGAVGEIWVKTPMLIDRYFNAPRMGADVLDADGLFRTGDVGYFDEDGFLYITDRVKDMIVSGGVNIYPAEIEAALHTHPAIHDVAVIGVPDDEFGEQVKAFVELKPGMKAEAADIVNHGRKTLSSYKLPKSVEIVDELPRNLMGKVMKRDLRASYWAGRERSI